MTDIDPNHLHTVNHDEQQAEQTDKCVICGIPRHSHAKRKLATDIERIKELLPKITQGVWRETRNGLARVQGLECCVHQIQQYGYDTTETRDRQQADAEFIVLCRNNIAALIEENERLKAPIDMVLACPSCKCLHVDTPEPEKGWLNPPHKSHLCHYCGVIWRPADVPTNGVQRIQTRGEADTWPRRIELKEELKRR